MLNCLVVRFVILCMVVFSGNRLCLWENLLSICGNVFYNCGWGCLLLGSLFELIIVSLC